MEKNRKVNKKYPTLLLLSLENIEYRSKATNILMYQRKYRKMLKLSRKLQNVFI
jgi:hypothetical protein